MIAKFTAHSKSILFSDLKIIRNLNTSNAVKHYYYYIIFLCQTSMWFWHKNKTEFLIQLTHYENFVNHRHLTSLSLNLYTTYYELIYIILIHIRFIIKKIFKYLIHTLEGIRNVIGLVNKDNNCIFLSWTS